MRPFAPPALLRVVRRASWLVLIALLLMRPGAAEPPGASDRTTADNEVRFVLQVAGRDAGYGSYRSETLPDGSRRIEGETLLKLRQGGRDQLVRSRRTTHVGADGNLIEYRATLARDDQSSDYVCRVTDGRLILDATLRGTATHREFSLAQVSGLLDYNAPEQVELFLHPRRGQTGAFRAVAVVLEMMSPLPLVGRVGGAEEIAVDGGATLSATKIEFSAVGLLTRVWIDADGRLARIEVPSQRFAGVRTHRRLEDLTLTAADLMRSFSVEMRCADGVADPGRERRRTHAIRRARFAVRIRVGDNRTDADALTNPHQRFTADAAAPADGWVCGAIEVTPQSTLNRGDVPPTSAERTALAAFLAPEPTLESDAPEIVALAHELGPVELAPLALAQRAADWVHGNVRYETQLVSALAACQGRVGDCLSMARLTGALLRARGIPARVIGGIASGGSGRFGQHHWLEVYGGAPVGWVQIDPTYGQSTGVDAFHLDLWREGTLDGAGDNSVVLESWAEAADTQAPSKPR